jgi:predicted dehydrogenase
MARHGVKGGGVTEQLRLGIVGCGEVVQVCHLPSLALLPEHFRITAVCDISATARAAVAQRSGAEHQLADYRALLERADIDAVLVANPHAFHSQVTLAALAAGKHVLVEKPMCLTLREADAIAAAQQASGRVVQVGTMRRYAPAFIEAGRLVRQLTAIRLAHVRGVLGRNALITGQATRVIVGRDITAEQSAAGQALEQQLMDEAIGPVAAPLRSAYRLLLGLSTHDLSTMRELLGRPQRLLYAAQRHEGRWLTAAFDYGDYICHFETGADDIPRFDSFLAVYGGQRHIRVDYDTPYVRHLPVRLTVTDANGAGGVSQLISHPNWGDPFIEEWRAFHEHVTAGRPVKNSPVDFRQDLEIFAAMIQRMQASDETAPCPDDGRR